MTPTPTVSVVVPTHGRGEALAVLVPQLLADQDLDELVVVVDGHGDPSEAFLRAAAEQDARLRPVVQENRGRTLARQRGADEATGDVVVFLDDDVLPRVPLAAAHARHHLDRDDLVVVGAMTTSPARWDPRVRLYDKAYRDHVALWKEQPERLLEHFWGGHFSMRRATLQRLDGFSPEASYGYHEDHAFGLRCLAAGLHGRYDASLAAEHGYERSARGVLRDTAAQARDRARSPEAGGVDPAPGGPVVQRVVRGLAAIPTPLRRSLLVGALHACDVVDRLAPPTLPERVTRGLLGIERYAVAQREVEVYRAPSTDLVGVVVPAYDAGRFLSDTLASLLAQEHRDWVCVVVDDGSTDGTGALAEEWARKHSRISVHGQANGGVASARNAGERLLPASCTAVLFLDADDVLAPAALRTLLDELARHDEAALVHCGWRCVDEAGQPAADDRGSLLPRFGPRAGVRVRLRNKDRETPFAGILCGSGLAPSMALVRRASFHTAGRWREDIGQPCEDTDLFLHLALTGSLRWVPQQLVSYRLHSGQSTADRDRLSAQWARLFERWRRPEGLTAEQQRVVADAWRWRERRFLPYAAVTGTSRRLAAGEWGPALRHLLGAVRGAARRSP